MPSYYSFLVEKSSVYSPKANSILITRDTEMLNFVMSYYIAHFIFPISLKSMLQGLNLLLDMDSFQHITKWSIMMDLQICNGLSSVTPGVP